MSVSSSQRAAANLSDSDRAARRARQAALLGQPDLSAQPSVPPPQSPRFNLVRNELPSRRPSPAMTPAIAKQMDSNDGDKRDGATHLAFGSDGTPATDDSPIALLAILLPTHLHAELEYTLRTCKNDVELAYSSLIDEDEADQLSVAEEPSPIERKRSKEALKTLKGRGRGKPPSDSSTSGSISNDSSDRFAQTKQSRSDTPTTDYSEWWLPTEEDGPKVEDGDEFPDFGSVNGPGADFTTAELAKLLEMSPQAIHHTHLMNALNWPRTLDALLADFERTRPIEDATFASLSPETHPQLLRQCLGATRGDFGKCFELLGVHARFVRQYGVVPLDQVASPRLLDSEPLSRVSSGDSLHKPKRKGWKSIDKVKTLPASVSAGPTHAARAGPWSTVARQPKPRTPLPVDNTPMLSPAPSSSSSTRWSTVSRRAPRTQRTDETFDECRAQASQHHIEVSRLIAEAGRVHRKFGGSAAGVYSERLKEARLEARRWELAGTRRLIADRQALPGADANTIDLHGATAKDAEIIARDCVANWWNHGAAHPPFRIICGAGTHSRDHKQVLLPAVIRVLDSGRWLYTKESSGLGGAVSVLAVQGRR